MDLNWLETLVIGFVSGLAEILPVSARTHNILLLKVFGAEGNSAVHDLLIHISILLALYLCSRNQLIKMGRALALSRIPKKRRKRPLDVKTLMDFRFLRTMSLPVIVAYLAYGKIASLNFSLLVLSALISLNGVLLYIPQFFPRSNKDSRSLSRMDGLFMGLGGALSVLPGFSCIGASVSVGSICGVDGTYALNISLLLNAVATVILIVFDVLAVLAGGLGGFSVALIIRYLLTAAAAFFGAYLGIRVMRVMAVNEGYSVFAFYCWGVALFAFILNLMA